MRKSDQVIIAIRDGGGTQAEQRAVLDQALRVIAEARNLVAAAFDYGTTGHGAHTDAAHEALNSLDIAASCCVTMHEDC